jgi:preprotein translocase subunit SecD
MQRRWILIITLALSLASLHKLFPGWVKGDFSAGLKPEINLGLDLQGGTYLKYEVMTEQIPKDAEGKPMVEEREAVDRAIEIMRNRVDAMGLKEPMIQREGERYVVVQLPGDTDPERTQRTIGATAQLQFKLVSNIYRSTDYLDANGNTRGPLPEGIELLYERGSRRPYLIESRVLMTGDKLSKALVDFSSDQMGQPVIAFELTSDGAGLFAALTEENIGRSLAIVLDGIVQSAPVIEDRIGGGRGIIRGSFTAQEVKDLALVLRSGALPAPLKVVNKYVVGPTLGADTIRRGTQAALWGGLAVLLFIVLYYRGSGVIAACALLTNLVLLLGAVAWMGATLTLPGIAGIVLTIGMSVDANVLIFERMREELRSGKSVRAVIEAGYENAMSAIVDAAVTTLIAAAVLFQFGTGPIKGFAVTFALGLATSYFTAIYFTRAVYDLRGRYDSLSI